MNKSALTPCLCLSIVLSTAVLSTVALAAPAECASADYCGVSLLAEVPLSRAVEIARRQAGGGRVLSADRLDRDGRAVYRIKLLQKDGRVVTVFVDAATGNTGRG